MKRGENTLLTYELHPLLRCSLYKNIDVHLIGSDNIGKTTTINMLKKHFEILGITDINFSIKSDFNGLEYVSPTNNSVLILLYDISSLESFKYISDKFSYLLSLKQKPILLGNKLDLEYWRNVEISAGVKQSEIMGSHFLEISSQIGLNFKYLVDLLLKNAFEQLSDEENYNSITNEFSRMIKDKEFNNLYATGIIDPAFEDSIVESDLPRMKMKKKKSMPPNTKSIQLGPPPPSPLLPPPPHLPLSPPPHFPDALPQLSRRALPLAPPPPPPLPPPPQAPQISQIPVIPMALAPSQPELEMKITTTSVLPKMMIQKRTLMMEPELESEEFQEEERDSTYRIDDFDESGMKLGLAADLGSDTFDIIESPIDEPVLSKDSQILAKKLAPIPSVSLVHSCGKCIYDYILSLFTKSILFDNVLADTENAFQTAAKGLDILVGEGKFSDKLLGLLKPLLWIFSFISCIVFTIILILPSFFTLLIVRTTTTEKESKNFGIRQEVIRLEKSAQSLLRWLRIISRSIPMTFFLVVVPYLLIFHYFPTASEGQIVSTLVAYISCILLLQVLGTVRAYYSWKNKDPKPLEQPIIYEPSSKKEEVDDAIVDKKEPAKNYLFFSKLLCCFSQSQLQEDTEKQSQVDDIPPFRSYFDVKSLSGLLLIGSLSLEFFQMSTFALQSDPYADGSSSDSTSTSTSTSTSSATPNTSSLDESKDTFWGSQVFEVIYVTIQDDIQYYTMWIAVCVVFLLLILFSHQFLIELRRYGYFLRDVNMKDDAKDYFFFSFTGSIVYGHGKPDTISPYFRTIVSLITDGLFLVINLRLLDVLACDYSTDTPYLLADKRIECWNGRHSVLAVCALISYAYYVPLSIMISPMLLEAPNQQESKKAKKAKRNKSKPSNSESYAQLYLMVINVVKSIMLLVASLGPRTIGALVASTTISSFIMGVVTIFWFHTSDVKKNSEIEPANLPFVNVWKSSSYFSSVITAILVVIANYSGSDRFSLLTLTIILPISWVVVIACSCLYYKGWLNKHKRFLLNEKEMIEYPFKLKAFYENFKNDNLENFKFLYSPSAYPNALKLKIPGSSCTPWLDASCSQIYRENLSISELIILLELE